MAKLNPRMAIYPGTFDPLTKGHMSLVRRGCKIFDTVVVAIAKSEGKKPLFTMEERYEQVTHAFRNDPQVQVDYFDTLLIDYVSQRGAGAVLRGLRAVSDFEYEFQMALMNRRLSKEIQTVFLMTDYKWMYLSSTIVKEVASHGGDVTGLVPKNVLAELNNRFKG